jgi:predicted MFS family arabinose efflux permease
MATAGPSGQALLVVPGSVTRTRMFRYRGLPVGRAPRRRATDPPLLLAVPALARSISATGLTGIALFGTFTFIPLAVATGTGADTAGTATLLLALTGGQLLVILTFSVPARRWTRLVAWGRLGLAMGIVGLALLAALPHPAAPIVATATAVARMALAGAALGLSMQAYILLGQATPPGTASAPRWPPSPSPANSAGHSAPQPWDGSCSPSPTNPPR